MRSTRHRSERKAEQRRVQNDWVKNVARGAQKERPECEKALNPPLKRQYVKRADDNASEQNETNQQWSPESLENRWYLEEKVRVFQILDRSAPRHVDTDRVGN